MKKTFLFCIVLCLSVLPLSAQVLEGWWNAGEIGAGVYSGSDAHMPVTVEADVLNVSFRHLGTGFMLTVSPFHVDALANLPENETETKNFFSLVNARLSYDIFGWNRKVDLSPYVAANWLCPGNMSSYKVEGGIRFDWYSCVEPAFPTDAFPYRMKILSLEAGAGLRQNTPYLSLSVSVDLAVPVVGSVLNAFEEAKPEERGPRGF